MIRRASDDSINILLACLTAQFRARRHRQTEGVLGRLTSADLTGGEGEEEIEEGEAVLMENTLIITTLAEEQGEGAAGEEEDEEEAPDRRLGWRRGCRAKRKRRMRRNPI